MQTVLIGKAKIQIEVKGCANCGTECSSGWRRDKVIPVTVGARSINVETHICAGCDRTAARRPDEDAPLVKPQPASSGRVGGIEV